jgi:hydroxymethylglutaryl-CoA lyase
MSLPGSVTFREVGTRDGIQSLGAFIPTEQKIELVDALSRTGLTRIEATSFVHPKAVPQMADAEQVMAGITRRPGVQYEALVPNLKGAERALAAGADALVVVTAASDVFNQRNIRMTVDESLAIIGDIKAAGDRAGVRTIVGISTSFGCPYSGDVPLERLLDVVGRIAEVGIDEIGLADTTGMANPVQVERTSAAALERFGDRVTFGLHFHNTRGMGLANVAAGLRQGITIYDASLAGIGGCPFAPKATGNVCTEDTVNMLHEMGIRTGVDVEALIAVAQRAQDLLGRELPGQVMKAGVVRHAAVAA